MKSAEAYPEYQGNPENIQFLSRTEHTQAHGGWKKPTNGYYDYMTGMTHEFNDDVVPCKVIALSDPIIVGELSSIDTEAELLKKTKKEQSSGADQPTINSQKFTKATTTNPSNISALKSANKGSVPKTTSKNTLNRFINGVEKIARKAGKFALEHKEEIIGVAVTFGTFILAKISSSDGNSSGKSVSDLTDSLDYSPYSDAEKYDRADTSNSPERTSPREHEVPKHAQRYHTKEGIVVREKEPYHRGGKNKK
jgi:hypothetical protein